MGNNGIRLDKFDEGSGFIATHEAWFVTSISPGLLYQPIVGHFLDQIRSLSGRDDNRVEERQFQRASSLLGHDAN